MNHRSHLFGRLHEEIRNADRILLVAHKKPDGDTLGSSSSMFNWLRREGKDVTAFCADLPPKIFHYLDQIHEYTSDPEVFHRRYDLVIVFDSGDLRYCGIDQHLPHIEPGYVLVNIDHHSTNQHYAHVNIVFTESSSTAEIVHRFYEDQGIMVDSRMATSLLTGLLTDTTSFSNAATTVQSMEASAKLLAAGARFQDALKHLWHNKSIDALRIWGLLLSRVQHNATHDIITTYLLEQDIHDTPPELLEGMSNFLQTVTGVTDVILVLRERPDGYIIGSFRSVRREISRVAQLMGGGGHKKAAGFTIKGRIAVTPAGPRVVSR